MAAEDRHEEGTNQGECTDCTPERERSFSFDEGTWGGGSHWCNRLLKVIET